MSSLDPQNDKVEQKIKKSKPSCVFCRVANHQDPESRVLFERDGIAIFEDIRPATKHHFLVVPKHHVPDPKHLGRSDIELVENLVSLGREFLTEQDADLSDVRFGFHWPPFNSISHLHLHVISPASQMGFLASFIFKPNSFWFVSADWVLNRLNNMNI